MEEEICLKSDHIRRTMVDNRKTPNRTIIIVAAVCFLVAEGYAIYLFKGSKPGVNGGNGVQTVRIGTFSTAIDYAPIIVAKSKGWLTEELGPNVNLEWTTFQTLPTINE